MRKRPARGSEPSVRGSGGDQVKTAEDLRRKIAEVRRRVDEATKPAGPLSLLKLTTST